MTVFDYPAVPCPPATPEPLSVWRKSSRSGTQGGECVEVAGTARRLVLIRDSKDPDGGVLAFGSSAWRAFTRRIKHGGFDG